MDSRPHKPSKDGSGEALGDGPVYSLDEGENASKCVNECSFMK
ncbi:MAG TPA: hypothetical protein VH724_03200 [Candidatus Angelobacter sp.]|nr:hypothetical protein [Candidatus Angelobacter sp.]